MNLQSTHHLKSTKIKRKKIKRVNRRKTVNLKPYIPLVLLMALIFIGAAGLVRNNSESENLNREASTLKMRIHKQNRNISNYNIRIATLKGEVIFSQIRRFKLNLHNPTAGQIRRLRISSIPVTRRQLFSTREPKLLLSRR